MVPMIGSISDLGELGFIGVRKQIKTANRKISAPTVVAVLEGILKHIYFDPLQAVREERSFINYGHSTSSKDSENGLWPNFVANVANETAWSHSVADVDLPDLARLLRQGGDDQQSYSDWDGILLLVAMTISMNNFICRAKNSLGTSSLNRLCQGNC